MPVFMHNSNDMNNGEFANVHLASIGDVFQVASTIT